MTASSGSPRGSAWSCRTTSDDLAFLAEFREQCGASVPARIRTSTISSVAYATDESGSEANTARATALPSRSWRAWASGIGWPTTRRFAAANRRALVTASLRPRRGAGGRELDVASSAAFISRRGSPRETGGIGGGDSERVYALLTATGWILTRR
jgi:hypothetical protein